MMCVLLATAAQIPSVVGESPVSGLVGDYRFGESDPLANEIKDGLPDLVLNHFDAAHPPLLTGQEIPLGGGQASANGWALAWTSVVEKVGYEGRIATGCRIPSDAKLALGNRFTLWMRVLYGGKTRSGGGYTLLTLDGPRGKPILHWETTGENDLALPLELEGADGRSSAYSCRSRKPDLLVRNTRWYDLAVVFDAGRVTFYATQLGRGDPSPTQSYETSVGTGLKLVKPTGPLWILKGTNTAIERLRIYREQALSTEEVRALSHGVRVPGPKEPQPVTVGTHRQLFVDDAVIERMDRTVKRQFHPAEKYPGNPIIKQTHPKTVEGLGPVFWGTVLHDREEQLFKMWYQGLTFRKPKIFEHLYAFSKDGIHWTKPKLGLVGPDNRYDPPGYKGGHAGMWLSAWKDPQEPDPRKRYKGFIQHDPYYYVTSPDGLRWVNEGIAAHFTDDTDSAAYHPQRREYLKIGRFCPDGPNLALRLIMACVSRTPLAEGNCAWHLVGLPDETDLAADRNMQFYHMPAFPYGDVYFGLLGVYHAGPESGNSETELTFSRDGLNWRRVSQGTPFIERGASGTWDGGFGTLPSGGPIEVGDELWFYYGHYDGGHHGGYTRGGIGLAKLRRDGFVSLSAGPDEGAVTIEPFVLMGQKLLINARTRRPGGVTVEILDPSGRPHQGLTREDCDAFTGDSCRHVVSWNGRPSLAALQGQRITLRFHLSRADLYSFEVVP